jgi:hypothetical protein
MKEINCGGKEIKRIQVLFIPTTANSIIFLTHPPKTKYTIIHMIASKTQKTKQNKTKNKHKNKTK